MLNQYCRTQLCRLQMASRHNIRFSSLKLASCTHKIRIIFWNFCPKIYYKPYNVKNNTYGIHFKINEFATRQCNNYLSLIYGAFCDRFFSWCFPFIDTFVGSDMPYSIGINLHGIKNSKTICFSDEFLGSFGSASQKLL